MQHIATLICSKLQHQSAAYCSISQKANCSINRQQIAASICSILQHQLESKLQHHSAAYCSIDLQQIAASICSILQHQSETNCSITLQHIEAISHCSSNSIVTALSTGVIATCASLCTQCRANRREGRCCSRCCAPLPRVVDQLAAGR